MREARAAKGNLAGVRLGERQKLSGDLGVSSLLTRVAQQDHQPYIRGAPSHD